MKLCLVVDDSKIIRRFAKAVIEEIGFEVLEAANGEDAINQCKLRLPDVILLDWNMPVQDGLMFLNSFRKDFATAKTKIIFCTTENELAKVQKAVEKGADEYIAKPFDIEVLKSKFTKLGLL